MQHEYSQNILSYYRVLHERRARKGAITFVAAIKRRHNYGGNTFEIALIHRGTDLLIPLASTGAGMFKLCLNKWINRNSGTRKEKRISNIRRNTLAYSNN